MLYNVPFLLQRSGIATSTKNIKRLTVEERKAIVIEPDTYDKLIGIMLSDGHVSLRRNSINARFHFAQSGKIEKKEYFDSVAYMMKRYSDNETLYEKMSG